MKDMHVVDVTKTSSDVLVVTAESARAVMGRPTCGVVAHSHDPRTVTVVDRRAAVLVGEVRNPTPR